MKRKIYLVGAGPGDPELMTLKAYRLVQTADVIFYDKLVNPKILDLAKKSCDLIYIGKEPGRPCRSQEEINDLLVGAFKNRSGTIVRLKGGDPFVFGRGGEEAETLAHQDIPFEIVPGISSSIAAAAYAGIPVTHRGLACSFAVITGHEAPGKAESQIHYESLKGIDTLVFMMAVGNRVEIASRLLEIGRPFNEPVAFVENGTTQDQRTVITHLGAVAAGMTEVEAPAVMIVGPVVRLSNQLRWFSPSSESELEPLDFQQIGRPAELSQ